MKGLSLRVAAASILTLLLGACTATSSDTTAGTTTEAPTTTLASTTTAPVETSTTTPTTSTTAQTTSTTSGSVLDEAEGSGCTPGDGDLPDGEWYGLVASLDPSGIEFDLACWFSGDAAVRAAAEDGEESPPPNDYYVRNSNPALRTVEVTGEVGVTWYPNLGDPTSEAQVTYSEWIGGVADRGDFMPGIWIEIEDGSVTEIREQWVP